MAKLYFILGSLLYLQIVSCRVVRDTQTQNQLPDLTELAKQAEAAFGELHDKFLNFVGVKNDEELFDLVKQQEKIYTEKLGGLAEQLKTEAGKADGTLQAIAARIGTAVEELKSHTQTNPDLQKFQEVFHTKMQAISKDTQEYGKKLMEEGKVISADVENIMKQIMDNTIETTKKVAHDVDAAIKEKKE